MINNQLKVYGEIKNILIKKYGETYMPEALVYIKRNLTHIPDKLLINDSYALIDFKGGPKRCYFCCNVGHTYNDCRRRINVLKRKLIELQNSSKENSINSESNDNNQEQMQEDDKIANNKKIEEQEYSCLVLAFYLSGLSQFLGLSEE